MLEDIYFILACLAVYTSFIGWGSFITGFLRKNSAYDLGMASAAGMAFSALAGGVFNLLGVVSPLTVRAHVILGLLCLAVRLVQNRSKVRDYFAEPDRNVFPKRFVIPAIVVIAGFLIFEIYLAGYHHFNFGDDFQTYLYLSAKMFGSGSLGVEPFSEGRMGLWGGHSFLQSLLLGFSDLHRIHGLDKGIAWLVFCSLIISHFAERRMHIPVGAVLVVFVHFIPSQAVNVSSSIAGLALFYALMRVLYTENDGPFIFKAVLVSLLAAGLCSLKNTHIAGCGMILVVSYLLGTKNLSIGRRVQYLLAIACISAIFLSSWMLDLYQNSGTILYPLLGKGHHGSVYGSFPSMSSGHYTFSWIFKAFLFLIQHPFFLTGALMLITSAKPGCGGFKNLRLSLAIFAATWLAALAMLVLSGGVVRYSFSFTFACTTFLLIEFFSPVDGSSAKSRNLRIEIGVLVAILLAIVIWPKGINQYKMGWKKAQKAQTQWSEKDRVRLETAQSVTPPGAVILARVAKPFLMNFKRNRIYTVDWPGGAGPPPGVRVFGPAEDIARYLRNNDVAYVMHAYGNERMNRPVDTSRLPKSGISVRNRGQYRHKMAFHFRLLEMARLYENVYDDGYVFVLDLNRPAGL